MSTDGRSKYWKHIVIVELEHDHILKQNVLDRHVPGAPATAATYTTLPF